MEVLIISHFNPYVEVGATANRFRGLIDGLCQQRHNVTIATVGGFQTKNEDVVYNKYNENLKVLYLSRSNHYNGIIGRFNTYLFDETFYYWIALFRIRKVFQNQYDIVWLTSNTTVFKIYLREQKHIVGRSFIELNEYADIYKDEGSTNSILRRYKANKKNRLFKKVVGLIDLFGVMTQTLVSYYQKMSKPEAKFLHLPMTVDLSRFVGVADSNIYNKPYICYIGTMNNQKDGVHILIHAFARIADKYPDLNLYLAGFWHYDVPMQDQLIKDFRLQNRIHRLGVLNRERIPLFVCNARVLVLSRPDSHQAQGGFPTKLGEYLASGIPVCVTRVGEIPNYLEDNVSAFLAEPGDVDSFANALDRALNDDANAKRVGAKGRAVAETSFDAKKQAARLACFWQQNLIDYHRSI